MKWHVFDSTIRSLRPEALNTTFRIIGTSLKHVTFNGSPLLLLSASLLCIMRLDLYTNTSDSRGVMLCNLNVLESPVCNIHCGV